MNKVIMEFKNLDKSILSLVKSGVKYNFGLLIISCLILLTYDFLYANPIVYDVGLSLARASLFFIVRFYYLWDFI